MPDFGPELIRLIKRRMMWPVIFVLILAASCYGYYWLLDNNYIRTEAVPNSSTHASSTEQPSTVHVSIRNRAIVKLDDERYVMIEYSMVERGSSCEVKFERVQIVKPEAKE